MKVAHVSPTFFSDSSVIGGGERFATELARAVAKLTDTTFVTFTRSARHVHVEHDNGLEIRRYPVARFLRGSLANPLSLAFLRDLFPFDCLHCYGYPTAVTDLCIGFAKAFRKKVFVTDVLGGGTCLSSYLTKVGLDSRRFVDGFLAFSKFSARRHARHKERVRIVGGGVDASHFVPRDVERQRRVLFVGRLIPIKGVDYLIDAVDSATSLHIVGRPYDQDYYRHLRAKATGKSVDFLTNASEEELLQEYPSALVTVTPSVYTDCYGRPTEGEGLCLVALESMASGTPVIASRCGGLVEVVEDGITGFLVPPNDSRAIREKIQVFLENPDLAKTMGAAGRERVLRDFTWDRVAANCLKAYREALKS